MNLISSIFGVSRIYGRHANHLANAAMVKELAKLLESAQESIVAVSGVLPSYVYGSQGLPQILKEKLKAGVKIEIVVGPNADPISLKRIGKLKGIKIHKLKARPIKHFVIVDGRHVRFESEHVAEDDSRDQFTIKDYENVDSFIRMFNQLKREARGKSGRKRLVL